MEDLPAHVLDAVTNGCPKVNATDHKRYRSMTGALIYLAVCTRPDIAYTIGMLSHAMHCPTFSCCFLVFRTGLLVQVA